MPPPNNGPDSERRSDAKQACTVLYDQLPELDSAKLAGDLQRLVGRVHVEWALPSASGLPLTAGVVTFREHRIAMIALDAPVKADVLARTVGVSPMPDALRARLMNHRAAIRLLYLGDAAEPLTQLTALYAVAYALVYEGGLGFLNERAALAQPAELALGYFEQLGENPPPLPMWIGVVSFASEQGAMERGYTMRTYGMSQFGLSELALRIDDRASADKAYHLLLNVCLYIIEGQPGLKLDAGMTVDFGGRTYLLTNPPDEPEFHSATGLLMLVGV